MTKMTFIAGATVFAAMQAEREARVRRNPAGLMPSEPLTRVQEDQYARGLIGVELVPTIYGWSVRIDTNLAERQIVASVREGTVDGTFADAERAARVWVDRDPDKRYAWVRGEAPAPEDRGMAQ